MHLSYRGTGGIWALVVLCALAVAGVLLMVTAVAAIAVAGMALAAVALLARALGWRPRRRPIPTAARFAGDTIEGTVVSSELTPPPAAEGSMQSPTDAHRDPGSTPRTHPRTSRPRS